MPCNDCFKNDFEDFAKEKETFVPTLGISYRIRDPQSISQENFPITYNLSSDSNIASLLTSEEDFNFAMDLKNNLIKISGKDKNKYDFMMKLITTTLDDNETPANFIYTHIRMSEDFYKKNRNIGKSNSPINMIGNYIVLWGLKNHKRPTELAFNYSQNGSAEENSRILKGHELEQLLKPLSSQKFGI